jgi:hypothetical protein
MPSVPSPYGVTAELVARRIPEFALTETSRPSLADAQAIVMEEGAYVATRLRRILGYAELDDASDTLLVVRGCVFDLVASQLAMLRGRGTDELHAQVRSRVESRLRQFAEEGASSMGDGATASDNMRAHTSASDVEKVRAYNDRHGGIGVRLATRGRL